MRPGVAAHQPSAAGRGDAFESVSPVEIESHKLCHCSSRPINKDELSLAWLSLTESGGMGLSSCILIWELKSPPRSSDLEATQHILNSPRRLMRQDALLSSPLLSSGFYALFFPLVWLFLTWRGAGGGGGLIGHPADCSQTSPKKRQKG